MIKNNFGTMKKETFALTKLNRRKINPLKCVQSIHEIKKIGEFISIMKTYFVKYHCIIYFVVKIMPLNKYENAPTLFTFHSEMFDNLIIAR